jgi:hypothetical protein
MRPSQNQKAGGVFYLEAHEATEMMVYGILTAVYTIDERKLSDFAFIKQIIDHTSGEGNRQEAYDIAERELKTEGYL